MINSPKRKSRRRKKGSVRNYTRRQQQLLQHGRRHDAVIVCPNDQQQDDYPTPLTREQALVFPSVDGISLDDYIRNVGLIVGRTNVLLVSRVSDKKVCLYLRRVLLVDDFIRDTKGITIRHTFLPARRLTSERTRRLILWNASPCIPRERIEEELRCAGLELCSSVRYQKANIREYGYDHVYSFRREVYVRVRAEDDHKLPDSVFVPYEGDYHKIYIGTDDEVCGRCKCVGHLTYRCNQVQDYDWAPSDEPAYPPVISMFRTIGDINSTEVKSYSVFFSVFIS